jgi:vancomycin resistance protein YoaR
MSHSALASFGTTPSGDAGRTKAAVIIGCALVGALSAVVLAPEPAARAAITTPVAVAGLPVAATLDTKAESARLAERYLGGSLRLRAGGRQLDVRRADLGAAVALDHLHTLLDQAAAPSSALRRVHASVLPDKPLALPMPARVDEAKTLPLLLQLKDEIDRDPVDAHIDPRKKQAVRARAGVALDVHGSLERIERALSRGASEVELPLLRIPARRTIDRFDHIEMNAVLGELTTRYNQSDVARDRTHNLEAAAKRVDGYVVEPGELFDFNAVVGDRTQFNGFKLAPVIAYGQLVDGVGGGTCQVASTLHGAVFFAGLPIELRHPHSRPSFYTKLGLDAAVAYGSLNFQFRNDRPYPIVLEVTVDRGMVRAAVHGKERDRTVTFMRRIDKTTPFAERVVEDDALPRGFRVLAQRGIPGFTVTRFRVVRDEKTQVSTRDRNSDTYPPTEQIIRIGTGPELAPDADLPRNDPHPEYIADELLIARQGPGIDGTTEERVAGRTGTYGWTLREGMQVNATTGLPVGAPASVPAATNTVVAQQ